MRAILAEIAKVAAVVFAVSSMLSVGLAYRFGAIIGTLRDVRAVFRALVANFVLVPLLAIGIERLIPMDPPLALGLFLLAGAAGAPFLIKLASAARSNLALSAALLMILVPATVIFLPFYVPLALTHPSLRALEYTPSSVLTIGLPLLLELMLPILLGLAASAAVPSAAARLVPIGGKVASMALVVVLVSTFWANFHEVMRILTTGALAAGVLLIVGAFVAGYLLTHPARSAVLGLGTAQRNIAAAMVIASQDFEDPDILVMISTCALAGLLILFPIAWLLSRQAPHVGLPTPEPASAS